MSTIGPQIATLAVLITVTSFPEREALDVSLFLCLLTEYKKLTLREGVARELFGGRFGVLLETKLPPKCLHHVEHRDVGVLLVVLLKIMVE